MHLFVRIPFPIALVVWWFVTMIAAVVVLTLLAIWLLIQAVSGSIQLIRVVRRTHAT